MIGMNQAVDYRGTTVYFQSIGRSVQLNGAVGPG